MSPRLFKSLFAIVVLGAIGGYFVMFGPPKLMARTESPDFCASCHVMESQFEAWFHTGAHRSIKCIDCHLPHDNIGAYYVWKSIDGMKDSVVFYSGKVPDKITLSEHGEKVLQTNCIRCHGTTVEKIDPARQCWQCHRWLQHSRAGIRLTN